MRRDAAVWSWSEPNSVCASYTRPTCSAAMLHDACTHGPQADFSKRCIVRLLSQQPKLFLSLGSNQQDEAGQGSAGW